MRPLKSDRKIWLITLTVVTLSGFHCNDFWANDLFELIWFEQMSLFELIWFEQITVSKKEDSDLFLSWTFEFERPFKSQRKYLDFSISTLQEIWNCKKMKLKKKFITTLFYKNFVTGSKVYNIMKRYSLFKAHKYNLTLYNNTYNGGRVA